MYAYTNAHVHTGYMCVHVQIPVYTLPCTCTDTRVHCPIYVHMYRHPCILSHMCAHVQTPVHTLPHMDTHVHSSPHVCTHKQRHTELVGTQTPRNTHGDTRWHGQWCQLPAALLSATQQPRPRAVAGPPALSPRTPSSMARHRAGLCPHGPHRTSQAAPLASGLLPPHTLT